MWSDISAFLCTLMFCFKGTVSQDFLLQVLFMNHLPPSLLKSANLWTYKICYICGPSACVAFYGFVICGPNIFVICDLLTQICCGHTTSANLKSANCPTCGRSTNVTNFVIPQICGFFRGLGENDSWKKPEAKKLVTLSL